MEILDAQIHLPHPCQPWGLTDNDALIAEIELSREAMDCVGVDAAVLNDMPGPCKLALDRYPDRFRAVCTILPPSSRFVHRGAFPLDDPDLDERVEQFFREPGHVALRTEIIEPKDQSLVPEFLAGRYERLFSAIERCGAPLFILCSGRAAAVEGIARNHPDLQIIVNHIGLPQQPMTMPPDPWETFPDVVALSKFENVAIQFSGVTSMSNEPYPYRDLWPRLRPLIEAFTPDRLMWASDFTRFRFAENSNAYAPRSAWAAGTYSDIIGFVKDSDELSDDDKARILAGTTRRILGWDN